LKHRLISRVLNRASGLSRRFDLEEFGDSLLWVAFNDQSLLLGAGFILPALRLWLLWHFELVSYQYLSGEKLVPRMGFGPISHANGTRVQAASVCQFQHRGTNKALIAGAVMPPKTSPVPALFGPISAAPQPSSLSVLRQNSCNRPLSLPLFWFLCGLLCYHFIHHHQLLSGPYSGLSISLYASSVHFGYSLRGDQAFSRLRHETRVFLSQGLLYGRNPLVTDDRALIIHNWLSLALRHKPLEAVMNGHEGLRVPAEIESEVYQSVADIWGRDRFVTPLSEAQAHGIREFDSLPSGCSIYKSGYFYVFRVVVFAFSDSHNTIYGALPLENLRVNISPFFPIVFVEVCAGSRDLAQFLVGFVQERLCWVVKFHF